MPQRSPEQAWKVALTAVALVALGMALYLQLFERRTQREEARLVLPPEETPLHTDIAGQPPEEPVEAGSTDPAGDHQPLPNAVLRREESGTGSTLRQFVGPPDTQQLLANLEERIDDLSSRTEESDRALRRDLDQWQAQVRRELDTSNKILTLLLVALVALVAHLLVSLWQPRR